VGFKSSSKAHPSTKEPEVGFTILIVVGSVDKEEGEAKKKKAPSLQQ